MKPLMRYSNNNYKLIKKMQSTKALMTSLLDVSLVITTTNNHDNTCCYLKKNIGGKIGCRNFLFDFRIIFYPSLRTFFIEQDAIVDVLWEARSECQ